MFLQFINSWMQFYADYVFVKRNTISFRGKIILLAIDSKYGNDTELVYLNGHKEGVLTFILHVTCIICA